MTEPAPNPAGAAAVPAGREAALTGHGAGVTEREASSRSGGSVEDDGVERLDRVLREGDYAPRAAADAAELLRLEALLRRGEHREVSRRFCVRVAEEAERFEFALLDVGARGNRVFAFLTEAVTASRWIAKALHSLLHLRTRIRRYLGDRTDLQSFRDELDACVAWLEDRLAAGLVAVRTELAHLVGRDLADDPFDASLLRGEQFRWRLPQDVDAAEAVDERERIAEAATAFLALADRLARSAQDLPATDEDLPAWIRESFGPGAAHEARGRMHGIQSTYDTFVAATPLEGTDADLKTFRGYVSILLHLLEAASYLLQTDARLSEDVRSARLRERTAGLVDLAVLRRYAVRFAVSSAALCFSEARPLAQSLLARYTRVRDVSLDLPPGRKLHLRPAGLIVRVVRHHGLPVRMWMGDQDVDARELMDVILLAASHPSETAVRFEGDERVLGDLQALFRARLGEEGFDKLPASLSYLREEKTYPRDGKGASS